MGGGRWEQRPREREERLGVDRKCIHFFEKFGHEEEEAGGSRSGGDEVKGVCGVLKWEARSCFKHSVLCPYKGEVKHTE